MIVYKKNSLDKLRASSRGVRHDVSEFNMV